MTDLQIPEQAPEELTSQPQKKNKTGRKVAYYCLLFLFLGIFIGCAIYIGNYLIQSQQVSSSHSSLAEQIQAIRDANAATTPKDDQGDSPITGEDDNNTSKDDLPTQILPEYLDLYAQHNDLVGWIQIPDTDVDYPVFQTKEKPDYYLNHNRNKKYSAWGEIYAREECDIFKPSDNIVLYGHHMKDGSMFASLDKFKKKAFWEDHQYFTFDTIYERHTYQIIAVFKTSGNYGQGYAYHIFNNAANETEFNEFMAAVHSLQMYDTGLTAQYGDMLLTLSTCEYTLSNGRFVVVAKRVS